MDTADRISTDVTEAASVGKAMRFFPGMYVCSSFFPFYPLSVLQKKEDKNPSHTHSVGRSSIKHGDNGHEGHR